MRVKILTFLLGLLSLFTFSNFAQTPPTESQIEKDKIRKELEKRVLRMLDDAVSEAGTLKLARNRVLSF